MTTAKKPAKRSTKKHGFRYCEACQKKLVKNGKENGKQRWRCLQCGTARIGRRDDVANRNRRVTYEKHLLGKGTADEAAKSKHMSRRTFDRTYTARLSYPSFSTASTETISAQVVDGMVASETVPPVDYLVVDATGLSVGVVAIARASTGRLRWRYAAWESSDVWIRIFWEFRLAGVRAVVSDGQKGIQKAVSLCFGEAVILQRCHFHVKQNLQAKLTKHPATPAGQDLQLLARWLRYVKTGDDMALFVGTFHGLQEAYGSFLKERTYYTEASSGRRRWHYTHARVRSAYRQIHKLIEDDQLFAYITHPELHLPTTTNYVEGGLNTRIAELLRSHRGMPYERQRQLVDLFLTSKQPSADAEG